MSKETPEIVVVVAAPVDAVWDALRDKEKIRHWHGWEDPQLDAEIDLIYFSDGTVEDGHTLTSPNGDRFVVEPWEGGSRVTLTRAAYGANPDWDAYYDDITEGWITFLHQLRFALERHPGTGRRTLFYSGIGVRSAGPAELLGLDGAVGSEYRADVVGEAVSGSVWFRSEHQVGLTVDQWGDGLLVLSYIAPGEEKPSGAAMAVLTLYDLGDNEREQLGERWQAWWSTRYPAPPQPDND
ncbi:hypothetical protein GCM10009554_68980 [Kribbella koreensis]|uniref:SRPBCC domain-containing protein n=1 Tax=Kribbella koreensis TaxID=57909 RepID=A0ABP4C1D3_9ACTN